ncbi:hypothetical protein LCI18_008176 [Fusarium solani-melongenae]|uniref:Uncharacterized protein n=1 Tax=Fusarium solani subsp. cucurbitae TaxID=2747967 RepID=A0ACD3Z7S0_FUSSC|nr:hypothetical protein LCI18_008176 [Fusarium solani-melongenae]
MAIQGITITAAMPVWLVIYFPLVGLINLFLHVVQSPLLPTTKSDIALMDVVVGHFGYLEFASGSELGTQFPRKVVAYAREVVARAGLTSDSSHLVHRLPEQADLAISDQQTQQDEQDQQEMQIPVSAVHDIFGPGLADLCPDYLMSDVSGGHLQYLPFK